MIRCPCGVLTYEGEEPIHFIHTPGSRSLCGRCDDSEHRVGSRIWEVVTCEDCRAHPEAPEDMPDSWYVPPQEEFEAPDRSHSFLCRGMP